MTAAGAAKLIEECAELQIELGQLQQILAKKFQYWYADDHPDGKGNILGRVEDEMGDVLASIYRVRDSLKLDRSRITNRMLDKEALFATWEADLTNNDQGIDRAAR